MRRQRFPFAITAPPRDEPPAEIADKLSRALRSLTLIEASLDELHEKSENDGAWHDFFAALIPVLDGIGALRDAVQKSGAPAWRRGMEILSSKLETLLASRGLHPSARVGGPFDPSLHRAAGARQRRGLPPGSIAEVIEEGWTFRGAPIRLASVIVAKEKG